MKPIVFTQVTEEYNKWYYHAKIGNTEIFFYFGEDRVYVEIMLWGLYHDNKCNRGGDCKKNGTERCNWPKCRKFEYYTDLVDHLIIDESYEFIAKYFDLPDIDINPAFKLFAVKIYITALLLGNNDFFYEPCHVPISLPYKDKEKFIISPWDIEKIIV